MAEVKFETIYCYDEEERDQWGVETESKCDSLEEAKALAATLNAREQLVAEQAAEIERLRGLIEIPSDIQQVIDRWRNWKKPERGGPFVQREAAAAHINDAFAIADYFAALAAESGKGVG